MKRIAWIDTITEEEAEGELGQAYERSRDPLTGKVDHIMRVHALHPQTLDDHLRLYGTLMHGMGDLTRAEREMIAVVVSSINGCHY